MKARSAALAFLEHARKQHGTAFGDHSAHSKAGMDFDQSASGSFRTRRAPIDSLTHQTQPLLGRLV